MPQAFNDTPVSNVLVDDADIDMIHYIAAPASNPRDSHNAADYNWTHTTYTYDYYQTTLSGCHALGCSLVFSFRGTRVAVYGASQYAVSLYKVDQGNVSFHSLDGPNTGPLQHTLLYQSEEMLSDDHILTVNVTSASASALYWLDWIEYNTTSYPSYTSHSSPLPSSYTSPVSTTDGSSSNAFFSTAQIAVFGTFALIMSATLVCLCYGPRRRKKRMESYDHRFGQLDAELDDPLLSAPRNSSFSAVQHVAAPAASGGHILSDATAISPPLGRELMLSTSLPSYHADPTTHHLSDPQAHNFMVSKNLRTLGVCNADNVSSTSTDLPPAYSP